MRTRKVWSQEEDKRLKDHYHLKRADLYKLFPNRSAAAVNIRVGILGLKREINPYAQGKLNVLLDESLESYYWIGYLYADGWLTRNKVSVLASIRDKEQIYKFANYIECSNVKKSNPPKTCYPGTKEFYSVGVGDRFIVPKIIDKFDFRPAKTYNPPRFVVEDQNKFLALFIGYIDGDGCIKQQTGRKDCSIRLHVHSSWIDWLNQCRDKLVKIFECEISYPAIDKRGYVLWNITHSTVVTGLKKMILKENLPVLSRKWNKIDENYISKRFIANENKEKIIELASQGYTQKEISKKVGLSSSRVCVICSELRKEGVL